MKRRVFLTGLAGTSAALGLSACGAGGDPLAGQEQGGENQPAPGDIVVGSANFTESNVLAELYAGALVAKGVKASTKLGIGSREVYLQALKDGSISIIGEYTGNLLQFLDEGNPATKPEDLVTALGEAAGPDLAVLKASEAANQDVYCVTSDLSSKAGLTSLADLKKISAESVLGGPGELQERPYGPPGLEGIYQAKFKEFKTYDSLAVKVKDLLDDKVQVASFFTTDSAIGENQLVQLQDPQQMILPQQVIPLVRNDVKSNAEAVAALEGVQAALTTEDLAGLNKRVDTDHENAKDVAADWLAEKGLA